MEKELLEILKNLHTISQFRLSVFDPDRNLICAYPREVLPFCQLMQKNPKAKSFCEESDCRAFQKACSTGKIYIYRCKFGLYEAVAPLYDYGVLSGYLMMGQTLDTMENSASDTFIRALPYVKNKEELKKTLAAIPIRNREQLTSCISIMEICASYITLSNQLKLMEGGLSARVCLYIQKNLASPLSISQLCTQFFCSKSTLTNTFRKNCNTTINAYITKARMERAMDLLKNDTLSIQDISEQCGFTSQNYFTKVFQKHCHMTPSEFRNKT